MAKLVNFIPGKEIKNEVKTEAEDFGKLDVSLPAQVNRFLDRAIGVIKGYKLPKNKEILIIAKILDALNIDKSQIAPMITRIKSAGVLNREDVVNESINNKNNIKKLTDLLKEASDRDSSVFNRKQTTTDKGAGSGSQNISWNKSGKKIKIRQLKPGMPVRLTVSYDYGAGSGSSGTYEAEGWIKKLDGDIVRLIPKNETGSKSVGIDMNTITDIEDLSNVK